MAVTACPQWVQTRSSPNAGASRRGGEFHEGAHTFATCSAYSSQLLPPRGTRRPRNTNRGRPLIATLVLAVGRHLRQKSLKDYSAAFR
jgi:hypothetical protein